MDFKFHHQKEKKIAFQKCILGHGKILTGLEDIKVKRKCEFKGDDIP